ncbi:acetone carboxylase [Nesterenkonia sp. PF2B19]|uniref:acetone carboxylase n=1 Tax=Nesterenkonia sp. PF2B19 TaxID=1881858 RepID=UPI000872A3C2|nr:acetone carboxylase [Nesterenkonia sp. PF2B19]OSM43884.1 acetone carboxylase [Nesterenkonia sp. PF2B19]
MDVLSSLGGQAGEAPGPETPQCSRKGCRSAAVWQILWNNPKIHDEQRRKVWLACDEHRAWLENFLAQRLFWRSTVPLTGGDTEESAT